MNLLPDIHVIDTYKEYCPRLMGYATLYPKTSVIIYKAFETVGNRLRRLILNKSYTIAGVSNDNVIVDAMVEFTHGSRYIHNVFLSIPIAILDGDYSDFELVCANLEDQLLCDEEPSKTTLYKIVRSALESELKTDLLSTPSLLKYFKKDDWHIVCFHFESIVFSEKCKCAGEIRIHKTWLEPEYPAAAAAAQTLRWSVL